MNPLISVIIPVYNPNFSQLMEAIGSILNQTVTDFEIIIVDDGSDNGFNLNQIRINDTRIIKLGYSFNQGISNALNTGIKHARGIYIARMDSDDVALLNRFELQLPIVKKHGIISSNIIIIDDQGKAIGKSRKFPFHNIIRRIQLYSLRLNPVNHPTIIGKKEIFDEYLYNPDFDGVEDFELWLRMSNKYKIYFDSNFVLYYRQSTRYKERKVLHNAVAKKKFKL